MRRIVVVVALSLSLGLHWGALQSVAWTSMLVGFAGEHGLDEAVRMTFDGAHPCDLCCAIRDARDGTPERPAPAPERQSLPMAVLPDREAVVAASRNPGVIPPGAAPARPDTVRRAPPRPPPRS